MYGPELVKMMRISERMKFLLDEYSMKEISNLTGISKSKLFDYIQLRELASENDSIIIHQEFEKLIKKGKEKENEK